MVWKILYYIKVDEQKNKVYQLSLWLPLNMLRPMVHMELQFYFFNNKEEDCCLYIILIFKVTYKLKWMSK